MIDITQDPGHGGRDPGAVGPTTQEKNNSLLLAKKVAALLVPCGKFNTHFTRDTDKDFCPGGYKGKEEVIVDNAILIFSDEDVWSAKDVSVKFGGIAVFTRQGTARTIPADAMKAKHLIVIGGATTGHANETLLSGNTKYDTAKYDTAAGS